MKMVYKDYTLSEAAVDAVSSDVQDYIGGLNAKNLNIQRIRLTVEELILNLLAHYGKGFKISAGFGKQFGRHVFAFVTPQSRMTRQNAEKILWRKI